MSDGVFGEIDMQDRYAGDVGDFGKFGLLRHLCGVTAQDDYLRLKKPGVIWYRVPDENHNADGKCTGYLEENAENDRRFRSRDETVYNALAYIVAHERTIKALEKADLLPGAAYSGKAVPQWKKEISDPRSGWFAGALAETAQSNLVFLDPDNGVGRADMRPTQRESCKNVLSREIHLLIGRKPRQSPAPDPDTD